MLDITAFTQNRTPGSGTFPFAQRLAMAGDGPGRAASAPTDTGRAASAPTDTGRAAPAPTDTMASGHALPRLAAGGGGGLRRCGPRDPAGAEGAQGKAGSVHVTARGVPPCQSGKQLSFRDLCEPPQCSSKARSVPKNLRERKGGGGGGVAGMRLNRKTEYNEIFTKCVKSAQSLVEPRST
jgi:hypothetical protein